MARKDIGTSWDRDSRNAMNDNFQELYAEYIGAGLTAKEAREKALDALDKSTQALSKSEQTQAELDQAILEGDSSPLGGQLSVGAGGKVYSSPQERLLKEHDGVTGQLADKANRNEIMTQTEFDSWVATLLDGGPSIFFDTLSALQTAYPNGAAGVALVRETDPARIYVWNGEEWAYYGEYQGIEVKDNTISQEKLTHDVSQKFISSLSNLFEKSNVATSIVPQSQFARIHIRRSDGGWAQFSSYHGNYQVIQIIKGHQYYIRFETLDESQGKLSDIVRIIYEDGTTQSAGQNGSTAKNNKTSHIITADKTANANVIVEVALNEPVGQIIRKNQMIIDLTALYGMGNEPTKGEFDKFIENEFGGWVDKNAGVAELQTNIFRDVRHLEKRFDEIEKQKDYVASDSFRIDTFNDETRHVIWYDTERKIAYATDFTLEQRDRKALYASYDFGRSWEVAHQSDQGIAQFKTLKSGYHIMFTNDVRVRRISPDFSSYTVWDRDFPVRRPMNLAIDLNESNGVIMFSQYGTLEGETYNIYKSVDDGVTWEIALEGGTDVRHWHSVQVDPYTGSWWACGGDTDEQSRFLVSEDDGATWDVIAQGSQEYRACGLVFTENEVMWAMDTSGMLPYIFKSNKEVWNPIKIGETPLGTTTLGVAKTIDGLMFGWTRVEQYNSQREKAVLWVTDGETIKTVQEFALPPEVTIGTANAGFTFCSLIDDENRWFGVSNRIVLQGSLGIKLPLGI